MRFPPRTLDCCERWHWKIRSKRKSAPKRGGRGEHAAMYLWRHVSNDVQKARNLRADKYAPVSSSIPDRNAQNIRLTEIANGP